MFSNFVDGSGVCIDFNSENAKESITSFLSKHPDYFIYEACEDAPLQVFFRKSEFQQAFFASEKRFVFGLDMDTKEDVRKVEAEIETFYKILKKEFKNEVVRKFDYYGFVGDEENEEIEEIDERKPSAYNTFMKINLDAMKIAHPEMEHNEAFIYLAQIWATIKTENMTSDTVPRLNFS